MNLKYAAIGLTVALSLAGCQRTSYDSGYRNQQASLPPLQAQPVPSVQSGQLADPTMQGSSQFPTAPAAAAPGAMTQGGTAIEGGAPRKVAKGDYILVPANTPHQYTDVQGLIMMTLHMPVAGK